MVADHLGGTHEGITDDEIAVLNKSAISVSVFDFSQLAVLLIADKIIASKASVEAYGFVEATCQVGQNLFHLQCWFLALI